jgi:hypothetical protein
MGAGPWTYGPLIGYTSVGVGCSIAPVRFNCFPEITIHRLIRAESPAWFSGEEGIRVNPKSWT